MKEGSFMVSRSNIGEDVVIRMVVANELPITNRRSDSFSIGWSHHGKEILRGLPAAS